MRDVIRSLAVAAALAIAATTASAQAAPAPEPTIDCGPGTSNPNCDALRVRSQLFDGITLTKAQEDSAEAITRRYRAIHQQLRAERLPVAAYNAQLLGLMAREAAEKRKLVAPEQLSRFDANAEALRKRNRELLAETQRRIEARQKGGDPASRPAPNGGTAEPRA